MKHCDLSPLTLFLYRQWNYNDQRRVPWKHQSLLSASVTRSLAGKYFSVLGLDRTHVEMLKKNQRNRAVGVNLLAKQGATCDEMDKQGGWTGTSHVRIHRIVCVCACTIVTAPDGG